MVVNQLKTSIQSEISSQLLNGKPWKLTDTHSLQRIDVFKAFLDLFRIISDGFLDSAAFSSTCTVGKYKSMSNLCSPVQR